MTLAQAPFTASCLLAGSDGAQARFIGQSSQRAPLQQACAVVPTIHKERDNTGSYAPTRKRTDDANCIHPRRLHRRLDDPVRVVATPGCPTRNIDKASEIAVKRERAPLSLPLHALLSAEAHSEGLTARVKRQGTPAWWLW